jgi:hypothetical protein
MKMINYYLNMIVCNPKAYVLLFILFSVFNLCFGDSYSIIGYDMYDDAYTKYLGKIYIFRGELDTDGFGVDSIFNEFSLYGNEYGLDSIWNSYGTYGSEYSSYSPMNEYASYPPIIQDSDGDVVGFLTINLYYYRNTRFGQIISEYLLHVKKNRK